MPKNALPRLLWRKLVHNSSALNQQKIDQLKPRWQQEWGASPWYSHIKPIDSSLPLNKFIKLISDDRLSRKDTTRICQLRTGHIPLNAYPHRIGRAEGMRCPACGYLKEDMKRFLLDCPSYTHKRWSFQRRTKTTNLNLVKRQEIDSPTGEFHTGNRPFRRRIRSRRRGTVTVTSGGRREPSKADECGGGKLERGGETQEGGRALLSPLPCRAAHQAHSR